LASVIFGYGRNLGTGDCNALSHRGRQSFVASFVGSRSSDLAGAIPVRASNIGHTIARRPNMIRKAKAVWRGTGHSGNGHPSTDPCVLTTTPSSFRTRFENENGTNPEELIAAAHAGCFNMALAFGLQGGGYTPTELTTEAAVTLEPEGKGFRITRS